MLAPSIGDEFDLVILSVVRSQPDEDYDQTVCDQGWLLENLGFITDEHQICVALTRAKFGLVIVGQYTTCVCVCVCVCACVRACVRACMYIYVHLNTVYAYSIFTGNGGLLKMDETWNNLIEHYVHEKCYFDYKAPLGP